MGGNDNPLNFEAERIEGYSEGEWIDVPTPDDISVHDWVKAQILANLDRQIYLQIPMMYHKMFHGIWCGPPSPPEILHPILRNDPELAKLSPMTTYSPQFIQRIIDG